MAEPSLLLGGAGYTLKVWNYKKVGGIGVNLFKNGKRKFGVDLHQYLLLFYNSKPSEYNQPSNTTLCLMGVLGIV